MLSDLQLVHVNDENLPRLLALSLHEHQRMFMPSIESSIELAANYPDAQPLAISVDGEICGFALYGVDEETGSWKIFRIFLDKEFQSQGLGKRVMEILLQRLKKEHDATEVLVVYNESNSVAERLYDQLGFKAYARRGGKVLSKCSLSDRHRIRS